MTLRLIALTCSPVALLTLTAGAAGQQRAKLSRTEVVVLVDLSDRIDSKLHPMQVQRDTSILQIIGDEFAGVVRRNRYLFSRDRLRAIYLDREGSPTEPRVDVAQMNDDRIVVVRELSHALAEFHVQAVRPYSDPHHVYDGADIWSWFRHDAEQTLRPSDTTRVTHTRIIILTDGYLEFAQSIHRQPGTFMEINKLRGRADWENLYPAYKLKPVGYKLPDTKVLMLEIAPYRPKANTNEQDMIERYWTDWFATMGITSPIFVTNDQALPSVRDAIKQFLSS
jgi:hypothetical protein